ncbi:MAG: hypothetical protein KIS77_03900 [Saprospiraceae bacterium]|nr:hypothetical protein [Saprospiraceae bacterium]
MTIRLLLFTLFFNCMSLSAQTDSPFEAEIRAFEQSDMISKPAKGQILLYGSSTMAMWNSFQQDLAGYPVINRGFGGSQMSDAILYFDRVVVPLEPSWILLYEGDNDLTNGKKTPRRIFKDFKIFMKQVKRKLPQTKVAVFSLRPSIARETTMPQQRKVNRRFKRYACWHRKRVFFIDATNPLLTPDRRPNPEFLHEDQLHLNAKGYEVWTKVTLDFLQKKVAKAIADAP